MNDSVRTVSLDFSEWTHYGTVDSFRINDIPIIGLKQYCYEIKLGEEHLSAGVFEYGGERTHVAWGRKSDAHCSFHALASDHGGWGEVIEGCPQYELIKNGELIIGFSVDGFCIQDLHEL